MNPKNTNPELILDDGAPVQCRFEARADAPIFWERCLTNATVKLGSGEVIRFKQWCDDHPKAIINVLPGVVYLCDAHETIVRECL